jgi:hypothetical protein
VTALSAYFASDGDESPSAAWPSDFRSLSGTDRVAQARVGRARAPGGDHAELSSVQIGSARAASGRCAVPWTICASSASPARRARSRPGGLQVVHQLAPERAGQELCCAVRADFGARGRKRLRCLLLNATKHSVLLLVRRPCLIPSCRSTARNEKLFELRPARTHGRREHQSVDGTRLRTLPRDGIGALERA